jgi:RsiW-degrading membrane proteinase PrsW (M82 family)
MVLLSLAAALLPSIWLIRYLIRSDAFPEPPRLILTAFALGVGIVLPVAFTAAQAHSLLDVGADPYLYALRRAFLTAAFPEEAFKFLIVAGICTRWAHFEDVMDGVVYGIATSLGFAAFENVLFVLDGGIGVAVIRSLTAMPAHAAFGAIMGYGVARAFLASPPRLSAMFWAFAAPLLLHGVYDSPMLIVEAVGPENVGLGEIAMAAITVPSVVIGSLAWIYARLNTLRTAELARASGTLPPAPLLEPIVELAPARIPREELE